MQQPPTGVMDSSLPSLSPLGSVGQTGPMSDSAGVTTENSTVDQWTRALGESVGSPGGGAGAGVMLSIAASLTSMTAGYTDAEPDRQDELNDIIARARHLRHIALQLADDDASASHAFGAAFKQPRGKERDEAIRKASLGAAESSFTVGERAIEAIDDLAWLAEHGNPSLIADVVVAFGSLRAAITGARTNLSFDLATLRSAGSTLEEVREQHPELWTTVQRFESAMGRIDAAMASVDERAAPTEAF